MRRGAGHGIYCLGCCWALMLLLFAAGVMNLIVIVALMLWVLAEKLLPYGEQTARASGVRAARPRCLDRYHLTPRYALRHTKGAYRVVAPARVVPAEAECGEVAVRGAREAECIGRRMPRVRELQRW